jgi:hypothetical protein
VSPLAPSFLCLALILKCAALGGGLYETVLVDRVWLNNPQFVQPQRGGINRKLFWAPMHGLFEVALLASIWITWADSNIRAWLLIALACHLAMRLWSFLYFIPAALRFEKLNDFDPTQIAHARHWIRLSVWRLPLEIASTTALCLAVLSLSSQA